MAVYTVFSFEQAEELLSKYDLGKLIDLKGIAKGIMNSNYIVYTDKGKYIMRILEGKRDIEEEKKELKYLEHIEKQGIPCPKVLMTKDNKDYIMCEGKMVSLFSFLEGSEVKEINEEILEQFGEILSKMHIASTRMDLKREEGINLKYLYSSVAVDMVKLENILKENFNEVIKKTKHVFETDFSHLPRGVIHNDIFPDNVFVKDGKISGVIDFNDALKLHFLHDIAIVLNFWIFNIFKEYKINLVKAFLRGYEKNRKLTNEEKEKFSEALDMAALTFLFLRIKKFNYDIADGAEREFKDFRDLLPMVFADKNILIKF